MCDAAEMCLRLLLHQLAHVALHNKLAALPSAWLLSLSLDDVGMS